MQPEISHRCSSCGATVRDADALFCPECGKPLAEQPVDANAADASEPIASSATEPSQEPESVADAATPESLVSEQPSAEQAPEIAAPKDDAASPAVHRRGEKTRERLHRASEVARGVTRGVIEEPAKRVEKIRHASTHVIEEASYDPSLRFVLVALGLFVVFIVLLVLSKVMG